MKIIFVDFLRVGNFTLLRRVYMFICPITGFITIFDSSTQGWWLPLVVVSQLPNFRGKYSANSQQAYSYTFIGSVQSMQSNKLLILWRNFYCPYFLTSLFHFNKNIQHIINFIFLTIFWTTTITNTTMKPIANLGSIIIHRMC